MNTPLNLLSSIGALKDILADEFRLLKLSWKEIENYQNKQLRKIVKYAYKVPVYRKKFDDANLRVDDIKTIHDLEKIPVMTRDEIRRGFPDDIIPPNFNKKMGKLVTTGGSTGKPLPLYVDWKSIIRTYGSFFSVLRINGFDWKKIRIANIGNLNPHRADYEYMVSVYSLIKHFPIAKRVKLLSIDMQPADIVKELDNFKPDCIISYGGILLDLAHRVRKGEGKNIKPRVLITSRSVLDNYTRKYLEDTFDCRVIDIYSAVETASAIAFQCRENKYHVHSDLIIVESLDKDNKPVGFGKRGKACITKLYGGGTPIIRYIGLDDWIILSDDKCDCGLETQMIERIEGRISSSILLPSGRVYPSTLVADVLCELQTFKIKRFQVVQKRVDKLEILVEIDDDLRDVPPSTDVLFERLRNIYYEKLGEDIEVEVKEVEEIKGDPRTGKPPPLVVSYVKPHHLS